MVSLLQLITVAVITYHSEAAAEDDEKLLSVTIRTLLPKVVHSRVVMILIHEGTP